jgi:uncharacterized coiled-coil protein SlyX
MPEPHDTERSIGRLQGQLETITGMVTRVLDNQDRASANLEAHVAEDRRIYDELRQALGEHRDRIVRVEMTADTAEGNASAIVDLERRVAEQEAARTGDERVRKNNLTWIGAAGAVGAVAGSAGSTALLKIWTAFLSMFKP